MKQSIPWYKQNLKDRKKVNETTRNQIQGLEKELRRSEKQTKKLELQINEAIRQNKDSFNKELFMKGKF